MHRTRPALRLTFLSLLCALLSGCSGFRSMTMAARNRNPLGDPAPPLTSTAWVLPDAANEAPDPDQGWRLFVFFKPT